MAGPGIERRLRRRAALLVTPGAGWIAVHYLLPAGLIAVYSLLSPRTGGGVEWRFSLDVYRALLARVEGATFYNNYLTVLVRSVAWSAVAPAICFVLALPVAVFIHARSTSAARYALLVAVMIPFWTSMLVRTYAIRFLLAITGPINEVLRILGREPVLFLNTRGAVILGLVYTSLPFMILPLYAAVARVDPRLLEAARDLGAGAVDTFRRVFLPQVSGGIVVGSVLVFVLSVSQFLVPTLLGGGKVNMVANLIELQFGEAFNWPLGSGLAIAFSVLTFLGLWLVTRRFEEAEVL